MHNKLSKGCIPKKRKNPLLRKKLRSLPQDVARRKRLWNHLFEKYGNHRYDISVRTTCPGEWDFYHEDFSNLVNCDDNSLNSGTCHTPSESIDSGIDLNSIIDDASVYSPYSRRGNGVNCNVRPGHENIISAVVESSILHHSANSSPDEVYSSKVNQCMRIRSEGYSSERSRTQPSERSISCRHSDPKPLKIGCELAGKLGYQTTVSSPKYVCLKSEIPESFDNIRFDGFKKNHVSLKRNCSEYPVSTLEFFNKTDSCEHRSVSTGTSGVNIRDQIKCNLQCRCAVRSETNRKHCGNGDVERKLVENQENGRIGCMQTENSHNQVLCNVFSKLYSGNVITVEHENEQNNFTPELQKHELGDNFACKPHSSSLGKEIGSEKVSKIEFCDVQQHHSCILEDTKFVSKLKGASHNINLFYPVQNKITLIEEQNQTRAKTYICKSPVHLPDSEVSVIKMSVNKKIIDKALMKENNNVSLTDLGSKIGCVEKNKEQRPSKLPKYDIDNSNSIIHHWEKFINNSTSLIIPLSKKEKEPKLQRLDWESIVNGQ